MLVHLVVTLNLGSTWISAEPAVLARLCYMLVAESKCIKKSIIQIVILVVPPDLSMTIKTGQAIPRYHALESSLVTQRNVAHA